MQTLLVVLMVGIVGGVAASLQTPMANFMSVKMGVWESIFMIHLSGAILSAIPLIAMRGGALSNWRNVPFYMLWAGGFGLVVIGAVTYTFPRVGVAGGMMIFLIGQLVMATVIDHFGFFDLDIRTIEPARVLGIAIMFAGVWLAVR